MKNQLKKKLSLKRSTVANLSSSEAELVKGGGGGLLFTIVTISMNYCGSVNTCATLMCTGNIFHSGCDC